MEEAVVGSVVSATIGVVLQNLLSVSLEEFNLFRDFKKDLQELKDSLLMIQDFLYDAEMQQVTNRAVKRWLKRLEHVAFEADNVFDELNYQVLRNKMETKKDMKKKVQAFFTHSNPIAFRRKMAHKIRDITEKLNLINQEARDFGLQIMTPVGTRFDTVANRETDPFTVDPIILGREDDVSRIVEMLTTTQTEQMFSVLPIVGMGGLGKTTLAREVFRDEKIKAHFEKQIWIYASPNFDAVILFKKILESLTEENIQHQNRGVLLQKLQRELSTKKYLLVLDDLWNENREKWDNFLNSLSGISSRTGNSMIVTTRGEAVASIVKTLPSYELKSLSEDKCWSIIKEKAFKEEEFPLELETIGRSIAKRCQGLPLAAKVVAGLLCDKSKDKWLAIEEASLSTFGEDENTVLKVLKLSFDHLPSPSLKKCFTYCSIFPKGLGIGREQLIELWMAEGFLTIDRSNDMETVGSKFFNLLVQNSLLQVLEKDSFGNIRDCNMHDLVHDLASSISGSKSNGLNDKILDDIYQVWYVAKSCPIPTAQARCVRTLILESKVFNNVLDFKSLHVLVIMCQDVNELPSLISELIHLRLLDISYTRIESLPDSTGKLYHLQTLRAIAEHNRKNHLRKLPNTLKNLISLRHLHIPNIELPPEIGRLTSLQTLPFFKVGNEKGCRIGELGSLKNLKGELKICNLERVNDKEEAKSACLFQKRNILKLMFAWEGPREGEINDENVLEGLQPHPNLKSLDIDGFRGRSFPLWTLKMDIRDDFEGHWIGLNNLMEVRLINCEECEEIPMLGHLPCLKSLKLDGLTNVTSIDSFFYGIDNRSSSTNNKVEKDTIILFPALESLMLSKMPNLREWVEVEFPRAAEREMVVFPCLEYLTIKKCCKLTSAPSHFPCLKELDIDEMNSASPLANICGSNLTSLTKLWIHEVNELVCLPDAIFCNNQNLSRLEIRSCPNLTHLVSSLGGSGAFLRHLWISTCPNLRELPDDLHTLSSLETFILYDCPNLKSIPYPSWGQSHQGFTSLRDFFIRGCKGLTSLPTKMIESCASSLRWLGLDELGSSTDLPMLLQKMPRLTSLEIDCVPTIIGLSTAIASLHNLRMLVIAAPSSAGSLDYKLMGEFLDDIFKGLQTPPHQLDLFGKNIWDSLPHQLQHLTIGSHLGLVDFGIESLPEWLGNMSSLQIIYVIACKKLTGLPSKEAMQRLTKLTELRIVDCPQLNVERCSEEQSDDSQWPKIAHIPNIYVDDSPIQLRAY